MNHPSFVGLLQWMVERFPPVTYTALVAAFAYGAGRLAILDGGSWSLLPAVVGWLFFLHLRIFDEHKDFEEDRVAYPDRVLSRGAITLAWLARLGLVILIAEALFASTAGLLAFGWWAAAFAFSVCMFFEFGLGAWLQQRLWLYAITHNPVVGLLAIYLYVASGPVVQPRFLGFVALASVSSLAVEVGRKLRLPDEEIAGVPSYTTELGQGGARAVLGVLHVLTGVLAAWTATAYGSEWGGLGLLVAVPGLLTVLGRQPAKRVELGASLSLLTGLLLPGLLT
ncbi:MAG: hypothetical protein KC912_04625 [Proteobacteria bacterium]|nr:hypothetical protein [Pseudomonadota bacterium]